MRNSNLKPGRASTKSERENRKAQPAGGGSSKGVASMGGSVPSLSRKKSGGSSHPVMGLVKEARGASHINPPRQKSNLDGYQGKGQPARPAVGTKGSPRKTLNIPRSPKSLVSVKADANPSGKYRQSGASQKVLAQPRDKGKGGVRPYNLNAEKLGKGIQKGSLKRPKSYRLV